MEQTERDVTLTRGSREQEGRQASGRGEEGVMDKTAREGGGVDSAGRERRTRESIGVGRKWGEGTRIQRGQMGKDGHEGVQGRRETKDR